MAATLSLPRELETIKSSQEPRERHSEPKEREQFDVPSMSHYKLLIVKAKAAGADDRKNVWE